MQSVMDNLWALGQLEGLDLSRIYNLDVINDEMHGNLTQMKEIQIKWHNNL